MLIPRAAGPHPLPNAPMPTWLVRFDENGQCVSPGTAQALLQHLRDEDYSDVLFYSHGWNTDFADAVDQYSRFLAAFSQVIASHPIPRFKPIFVGVTWPSVWLAEGPGPTMASVGSAKTAVEDKIIAEIAAPMDPANRDRLYALTDAQSLAHSNALELATLIAPSIGKTPDEVDGDGVTGIEPADIVEFAVRLADSERTFSFGDNENFDDMGMVGGPDAHVAGGSDMIDPRNLLRLFSLFQMKDRAGTVGAKGVAILLRQMQNATTAKIRVFGHSFGAKVMLSAICAPDPLPREVDTLLLLQPAISHLAMASEIPGRSGTGGYRSAIARVKGPIFTTFSAMDQPLHGVFHLALRRAVDLGEAGIAAKGDPPNKYAALGGYGPRKSGESVIDPIPGPGVDHGVLTGHKLVGLDGSDNRITSHGDVANGYTAWALRRLIVEN